MTFAYFREVVPQFFKTLMNIEIEMTKFDDHPLYSTNNGDRNCEDRWNNYNGW